LVRGKAWVEASHGGQLPVVAARFAAGQGHDRHVQQLVLEPASYLGGEAGVRMERQGWLGDHRRGWLGDHRNGCHLPPEWPLHRDHASGDSGDQQRDSRELAGTAPAPAAADAATGGGVAWSAWSATSSAICRPSSSSCMATFLLPLLQVGAERGAGSGQPALYRPGRQPKLLGDLLHRKVRAVVQHQDLPVVERQQLQAGLDREPVGGVRRFGGWWS
jgi:hypothetical protein